MKVLASSTLHTILKKRSLKTLQNIDNLWPFDLFRVWYIGNLENWFLNYAIGTFTKRKRSIGQLSFIFSNVMLESTLFYFSNGKCWKDTYIWMILSVLRFISNQSHKSIGRKKVRKFPFSLYVEAILFVVCAFFLAIQSRQSNDFAVNLITIGSKSMSAFYPQKNHRCIRDKLKICFVHPT